MSARNGVSGLSSSRDVTEAFIPMNAVETLARIKKTKLYSAVWVSSVSLDDRERKQEGQN